jgi:hypothetical protein
MDLWIILSLCQISPVVCVVLLMHHLNFVAECIDSLEQTPNSGKGYRGICCLRERDTHTPAKEPQNLTSTDHTQVVFYCPTRGGRGNLAQSYLLNASLSFAGGLLESFWPGLGNIQLHSLQPYAAKVLSSNHNGILDMAMTPTSKAADLERSYDQADTARTRR